MGLQRHTAIFSGGERYTTLLDDDGLPDFWVTLFLTTYCRAYTLATMEGYVGHLVHFRLWEDSQSEPLLKKVHRLCDEAEGLEGGWIGYVPPVAFLTSSEAASIATHCSFTSHAARRRLSPVKKKHSNTILFQAAMPTSVESDPTVSVKQQYDRLTVIAKFVRFMLENALRQRPHYADYYPLIEEAENLLLKQRVKVQSEKGDKSDPDRKAPPPEVFMEVLRLADPECPDNPYTALVRKRNYLIIRVLFETGLRGGELLQLKVDDLDFASEKIKVRRRHDDPEDVWRRAEPNAKTQERDMLVSDVLIHELREYVRKERRDIINSALPPSQRHGFLFVSYKGKTKGQPMSISQAKRLVQAIAKSEALAEFVYREGFVLPKGVARHGFRHNFNHLISSRIDEHNRLAREEGRFEDIISEKEEIDQRMLLNGHKSKSSAEVYTLRHTKEKAEKLVKPLMDEIDKQIRGGRVRDDRNSD